MATGTKVADVYIDIHGDLTNYNKSIAQAKEGQGLKSLVNDIRTALSGGIPGRAGFASLITDLRNGTPVVTSLRDNLRGIGTDLKTITFAPISAGLNAIKGISLGAVHTGLSALTNVAKGLGNALKSIPTNIFKGFTLGAGLGAFLSLQGAISGAVKAIPDLIAKGRDYANEVDQIVDVTGAASRESSVLAATLNFLGQDVSTVFIRLGQMSKSVVTNEAELNRLGVATRDASGHFLNQVQLLDSVRSAFSKMSNTAEKTRLEILLFGGRGGLGQLVDYLQLTDAEVAKLTANFEQQGLIVDDTSRQLGEQAARAFQNVDNAITGLATTLFETVAPQLVAFFDGLAAAITANAQQIADVIGSVVSTVIGFVSELTGINLNFSSITTQIGTVNPVASAASIRVAELEGKLDGLKKQLKNAGGEAADFNAGQQRGIQALQRSGQAIDRQITKLNALGQAQERAFRKGLTDLERTLDLQQRALDLEDERISRQERDVALDREAEQAKRGLEKATRDLFLAQRDLANAQAQYQEDLANPDNDPAKQQDILSRDLIAIESTAQGVRDATQGIADARQAITDAGGDRTEEQRRRAADDRRAQLAAIKAYIDGVAAIADADNKAAAAKTLKKREDVLTDRQDQARAVGNAQEVADLQVKIDAIRATEKKVQQDKDRQAEVDDLNKRKQALQDEMDAFRNAKVTQTSINKAQIAQQIKDVEAQIAKEKAFIADEQKKQKQADDEKKTAYTNYVATVGEGNVKVVGAFDSARQAGIKFADDVKKALAGVVDILLGPEGKTGGRSGGIVGALQSVADTASKIAGAVGEIADLRLPKIDNETLGKALMAGALSLPLPVPIRLGMLAAGLALVGPLARAGQVVDNGNGTSTIPNLIPGFPGFNFNTPGTQQKTAPGDVLVVPQKARGGEVSAGKLYQVNELGIELFRPKVQGTIIPLAAVKPPPPPVPVVVRQPFVPAAANGGPIVIESHNHLTLPWSNQATDFVSRELAYRRRR